MNNSITGSCGDILIKGTFEDKNILGAMLKIEITPDPDSSEEKAILILHSKVEKLIHQWIKHKNIEGVCAKEYEVLVHNMKEQAFD